MLPEQIKSKIEKLLALAASPVEAEAIAAMNKARALMAEYNLTEATVAFGKNIVEFTGKPWERMLFFAVYGHTNCFCLYNSSGGYFTVYGREGNRFLAHELFTYLRGCAEKLARCYCTSAQEKKAFLDGYCTKMEERLDTEPGWAIDAGEQTALREYAKETGAKWHQGPALNIRPSDYGRYAAGTVSLHKQAGGGGARLRIAGN